MKTMQYDNKQIYNLNLTTILQLTCSSVVQSLLNVTVLFSSINLPRISLPWSSALPKYYSMYYPCKCVWQ